jgi:hypothetical protein
MQQREFDEFEFNAACTFEDNVIIAKRIKIMLHNQTIILRNGTLILPKKKKIKRNLITGTVY